MYPIESMSARVTAAANPNRWSYRSRSVAASESMQLSWQQQLLLLLLSLM